MRLDSSFVHRVNHAANLLQTRSNHLSKSLDRLSGGFGGVLPAGNHARCVTTLTSLFLLCDASLETLPDPRCITLLVGDNVATTGLSLNISRIGLVYSLPALLPLLALLPLPRSLAGLSFKYRSLLNDIPSNSVGINPPAERFCRKVVLDDPEILRTSGEALARSMPGCCCAGIHGFNPSRITESSGCSHTFLVRRTLVKTRHGKAILHQARNTKFFVRYLR